MKITKLKTHFGEFGSPVSIDLDTIIERMRSEETKAAADVIRKATLNLRLLMEKGMPRYYLQDTDRLPYLLFSATFGKRGLDHPNAFTQLLLLDIPCPEGLRRVSEMKKLVSQVPYTMLAFAGVSGVTLKVVVRCEYNGNATPWISGKSKKAITLDTPTYLTFLKDAQESAAEGILPSLFEPTTEHTRENLWRVIDIQNELSKHLKSKDVPNLRTLGSAIKALRWPKGANNGVRGYYLKLRKTSSQ